MIGALHLQLWHEKKRLCLSVQSVDKRINNKDNTIMRELFQKAIEWLQSRVTAIMSEERRMKSEEVKDIPINCGIVCTPATPDSCTPNDKLLRLKTEKIRKRR